MKKTFLHLAALSHRHVRNSIHFFQIECGADHFQIVVFDYLKYVSTDLLASYVFV